MRIFITLIRESIQMALQSLLLNRLRSFLSILGITIGIFSIIMVLAAVGSLEYNVRKSVDQLGSDVVFIQKWPIEFTNDYPWWKYINRPLPSLSDFNQLRSRADNRYIGNMAMEITSSGKTVKRGNNTAEGINIYAVSDQYEKVVNFDIEKGRYLSDFELYNGKPVGVIGSEVAGNLFPNEDPVGKSMQVLGRKIEVIGVLKRQGESIIGNSYDNHVIVPILFARGMVDLEAEQANPCIYVKAAPGVTLEDMEMELRRVMRGVRQLKPAETDNFAMNKTTMISEGMNGLFSIINIAGWFIGALATLVGGFGIANIMFVSVKERTNIIGIQKALGAKNYFILLQFLTEAVVLCLIGGLIGIGIVYVICFVFQSMDIDIFVSVGNFFAGIFISILVGIMAGFIPAWVAASMSPVEAMRAKV